MKYTKWIIICMSSLPFLFTLDGDFVFDDSEAVVKNKDITSKSWTEPFYHDFWGADIKSNLSHKSYRPLTILSYKIDFLLCQRFLAFDFKTTNLILCHILCCLIVWKVFATILNDENTDMASKDEETNKTSNDKETNETSNDKETNKTSNDKETNKTSSDQETNKTSSDQETNKTSSDLDEGRKTWWMDTAFLSTLLFAVHPVHVEAVSGVVGRADLLAAITFFQAFLNYHKSLTNPRYSDLYLLATVILAGISMLCKENGVTVLGFCLVYEVATTFKIKKSENRHVKTLSIEMITAGSIFRIITIALSIAALLYGRWLVMGGTKPEFKPTDNPAAFASTYFSKIATYNYIYALNLLLFIWPQWLCYDWSMGCVQLIENPLDRRMVFICMMYLYGLYLLEAIFRTKKNNKSTNRAMLLAAALIVIPFLPASNIFYPVGFVIAERILYISSAGYCLLIGIGLKKLLHRRSPTVCKIGVSMFILLVLIYALRSWQRSKDWQSEYSLFTSGLAVCPSNAKVHYNVAKVADANHQITWALAEYKEAIRLYPEYYQAMNNLANLLKNQKQYDEAESFLRLAIKHKEDFPAAWMNLGILLATTRRFDESELAYKTALRHRKKYPDCYYNLGNLYLELNKTEDAIDSWFQAINQNSKHVLAWTNLMALLDNTGQIDRALKIIPNVLKELPNAPSINFAIANMYGKINRFDEAETHFFKAIQLFNTEVKAIHYANLGVLYHRWKKYALAEDMYRHALKIDPTFKTARANLISLSKLKNI